MQAVVYACKANWAAQESQGYSCHHYPATATTTVTAPLPKSDSNSKSKSISTSKSDNTQQKKQYPTPAQTNKQPI
jgi:hypothetical protein